MTTTFYAPIEQIHGDRITLADEEFSHAIRVLRHREGDIIHVVDGLGGWYSVRLDLLMRDEAVGQIVERRRNVGEAAYDLTIAFALLKSPARLETLVEKASELGVRRLIPVQSDRTERAKLRSDRLDRIALAAMKQCGRSRLLEIASVTPFEQVVREVAAGTKLICHERAGPERILARVLQDEINDPICIAVGPEGGFTDEELALATSAGFSVASLGPRRLRAETAGIVAATAVMLHVDGMNGYPATDEER